jgi:WD40 repeat protein
MVVILLPAAKGIGQQPAAKPPAFPPINPGQAHMIQKLGGFDAPSVAVAYVERTDVLVAACEDGSLQTWDKDVLLGIRAGDKTPHRFAAHAGPITALSTVGETIASAGVDGKLLLWTFPEGRVIQTLAPAAPVRALAASSDGKMLAAGGEDGAIQLWDPATGKPGLKLAEPSDWILALAFSPDGKHLAAGGYDKVVRVWDVAAGKKLLDIPARPPPPANAPPEPAGAVGALAFSPDGKELAIGGSDARVHIVNPADGKLLRTLTGHESSITALTYHPSGTVLLSAARDHTIRLWTAANGQPIKALDGHAAWVSSIALMGQGTRLASAGADQAVILWDLK